MLPFILLFFLLLLGIHYLFYSRVIRRLLISERNKKRLTLLLSVNYLFNLSYGIGRYSDVDTGSLYYFFSLSIGITFTLLLYLLIHELLGLFHKSLTHFDRSRRALFKKSGDGALTVLSASYLGAGVYGGSKEPVIQIVQTGCCDFPIVQISDLHIGGLIDRPFVAKMVEKINALNPALIVITGDLVDTAIRPVEATILELKKLRAPQGIYMVLGNHEYFHNPLEIISLLRQKTSIKILLNESVTLDTLRLNIVGLTDIFGRRIGLLEPDIDKAYRHINPNYRTLLLVHQPRFIRELGPYRPDLILSGHTHGGQIWPLNYLVLLQQPYVKGLHTLPYGGKIYINSGIGYWGPPMRLGSQAEITYLRG
jgi:predicted MPP superfamily phosphohydrolase